MKKINIGISMDFRFGGEQNGYSEYPYYAHRENLISAFIKYANVLLLPHDKEAIGNYMEILDGIVLSSSRYHLDPFYYGEAKTFQDATDNRRADFEFEMIRRSLDKRIPILGIAGGMQAINVFFGGTMYQDIATQVAGGINHVQKAKGLKWHQAYHDNIILPNTLLSEIVGSDILPVNSAHMQAVRKLGDGLKINALSKEDNIIEGIESENPNYWVMGLEWHPEYTFSRENPDMEREKRIFDAFIKAASDNKNKKWR